MNIVETTVKNEKCMNPVSMMIIDHRKEIGRTEDRNNAPSVLKFCTSSPYRSGYTDLSGADTEGKCSKNELAKGERESCAIRNDIHVRTL